MKWNLQHKRYLPIAVLTGLIAVALVIKLKPAMQHQATTHLTQTAQYIVLKNHSIRPEISGFGKIEPNISLSAIAEVSGKIVFFHPKLKKGELLPQGTLLLKIDDRDYLLQVAKAKAELASVKMNLAEKKMSFENSQLDFALSEKKLALANTEYQRVQNLFANKHVSSSELNQAQNTFLIQQQELQEIRNQQKLFPLEISALEAQQEVAQANLSKSQLDLASTEVRLPFTGRIHSVEVEKDQLVNNGTLLFNANDIDKVLINAQFPLSQFSRFSSLFISKFNPAELGQQGMQRYLQAQGLSATVSLLSQTGASWQAEVERFSDEIDPQTQTIGVVVSIRNSYDNIRLGQRPPLLAGMQARVNLQGKADSFVVLPRYLVHNNSVLIAKADSTLSRVPLMETITQNNLVLSRDTSLAQQNLITSDLFPAIEGNKVKLSLDQATSTQLANWLGTLK